MDYASTVRYPSARYAGVEFTIARMSMGRRIELGRQIREIGLKLPFLEAGAEPGDQIEAGILQRRIDRVYLLWGLSGVDGLTIDGEPPCAETLFDRGPEDLVDEILTAIRSELRLNEEERKN